MTARGTTRSYHCQFVQTSAVVTFTQDPPQDSVIVFLERGFRTLYPKALNRGILGYGVGMLGLKQPRYAVHCSSFSGLFSMGEVAVM